MAIELPDPITAAPVIAITRLYPHVDGILEWQTQQSVRLLWDRVHDLEEQLRAVRATQTSILAAFDELLTAVDQIQIIAEQAIAKTQEP